MDSSFIKKDVAKETGLNPRTVTHYTDLGLVIPGIENPKGRGTTRKYSHANIFEFFLVKRLASYGLGLKTIRKVMDRVRGGNIKWQSLDLHSSWSAFLILYDINGVFGTINIFYGTCVVLKGKADAIVVNLTRLCREVKI